MKVYDILTPYNYSQKSCVVAKNMAQAENFAQAETFTKAHKDYKYMTIKRLEELDEPFIEENSNDK